MKNIYKASILTLFIAIFCLSQATAVLAQNNPQVQTSSATNMQNNSVVLNGYLSNMGGYSSATVWFQYGLSTSYSSETTHTTQSSTGLFSQAISGLAPNTTFHFRAVAQNAYGTNYGSDMTFMTGQSGQDYGTVLVSKKVINLTNGNLNWSTSVNANPSDILSFAITIQPSSGQNLYNVVVRDSLPAGLIFRNNVTVNTSVNYSGDITSGINIGTVYASQPVVVSYQAQVSPYHNFNYGTTILNNSAYVTSSGTGSQTSSATIFVTKSYVSGASVISTGLTNRFLTDSFLLPMLLILAGIWLWKSGIVRGLIEKSKS